MEATQFVVICCGSNPVFGNLLWKPPESNKDFGTGKWGAVIIPQNVKASLELGNKKARRILNP